MATRIPDETQLAEFADSGVLTLPELFDAAELVELCALAEACAKESSVHVAEYGRDPDHAVVVGPDGTDVVLRANNLEQRSTEAALHWLADERIAGIGAAVCGADVVPTAFSLYARPPGELGMARWHQDSLYERGPNARAFTLWLVLDAHPPSSAVRLLRERCDQRVDVCELDRTGWSVPGCNTMSTRAGDVVLTDLMTPWCAPPPDTAVRYLQVEFWSGVLLADTARWPAAWTARRRRMLTLASEPSAVAEVLRAARAEFVAATPAHYCPDPTPAALSQPAG